jgi:hypothetical protein
VSSLVIRQRRARQINSGHVPLQDANIPKGRHQAANRCGNVGRAEARHRDLIQERLKQMVIGAIDDSNVNTCGIPKRLYGVQPAESRPDNDNVFGFHLHHFVSRGRLRAAAEILSPINAISREVRHDELLPISLTVS